MARRWGQEAGAAAQAGTSAALSVAEARRNISRLRPTRVAVRTAGQVAAAPGAAGEGGGRENAAAAGVVVEEMEDDEEGTRPRAQVAPLLPPPPPLEAVASAPAMGMPCCRLAPGEEGGVAPPGSVAHGVPVLPGGGAASTSARRGGTTALGLPAYPAVPLV